VTWLRRLWFMLRRNRLDDELKAEIEWHIQQRASQLVRGGMDEASARQAAVRAFGNPTRIREDSRELWGFVVLDLLLQDVRYALRTLARQPLLAVVAIVSLGSAMAASTGVFSLANAVLFRELPVSEPDRLVLLRWTAGPRTPYRSLDGWNFSNDRETSSTSFSYDAFRAAQSSLRGRAGVFAFADLYQVNVGSGDESDIATGQVVSGNYFSALGLAPAAGRFLAPADDRVNAEPAAVLSHAFWLRRFGGDPGVVGRAVRVNGVPTTVVGIAPPGFNGTRQIGETADVSVPMALRDRFVRQPGDHLAATDPRYWWIIVMARLAPGEDAATVQPGIELAVRRTIAAADATAVSHPFRVDLLSGARGMFEARRELVEPIEIMAGIVVVVVLIACANLANLLLARAASRDREVAVRLALGASRGRIVRQLLIESVLIGLVAGAVGLAATRWIAEGLLPAMSLEPVGIDVAVDGRVLGFAFAAALACAMLFGLVPAWRATEVPPVRGMKEGSAGAGRVPRLRPARAVLVAQVGLSVLVLIAAGLLVRTMRNLQRVEPGFDARGVLTFRIDPTLNGYEADRIRALYETLLERFRALPGVEQASFSHHGLLYGWSSRSSVQELDGAPPSPEVDVNRLIVDPDFFRTMRIPIVAGRGFTGLERPSARRAVVINREFARSGFKMPAPIGHRFRWSTDRGGPTYEVVGVAGDARIVSLRHPVPPTVYLSYRQEITYGVVFVLRTAGRPEDLVRPVRRTVASVDPDLPLDRIRTQEAQLAFSLRRERLFAALASALGGLALLLACIGIYGLMAYAVSRRTMEIGIRMALGAQRGRVLLMVVGDAGRLMAAGLFVGVGAALASARSLESLLFGLTPTDARTQTLAIALLAVVALLAAYLPARRASRVDPLVALRYE
jgi:predicted permease